ncbi:hypothetical protein THMIRHAT_12760 [Thiosulfativibrio zosterae]|uniref:Uncharacterized protein n=1 Tax=Thiosulfativibrio zosterae TaxID=2675053 RepID=A0A6F8PNG2_9GAMM|nr:hypothetical protein THMIRHAT_12760 [Thiosulfativibrio zosterae]
MSLYKIRRKILNVMLLEAYDKAQSAKEKIAAIKVLGKVNGLYPHKRKKYDHYV